MTQSEPNQDLSPQQALRNRTFVEAAARVQQDSSSESVNAYISALANATFLYPRRRSEAGVEIYVTHYRPSAVPLLPVFTSIEEYEAFGSVIPAGYGADIMASVSFWTVDLFPGEATLAINPARPNFFRVPPNLIRIIAKAEWQPNDPT